jgi:hypothetical protein
MLSHLRSLPPRNRIGAALALALLLFGLSASCVEIARLASGEPPPAEPAAE